MQRIVLAAVVMAARPTRDAQASEPSRVVLVGGGAELDRAARVALSSWNVTVVSADGLRSPSALLFGGRQQRLQAYDLLLRGEPCSALGFDFGWVEGVACFSEAET
jgi:hypothetical protein